MKYETFLPQEPLVDDLDFAIHGNDVFRDDAQKIVEHLKGKKKEILKYFGLKDYKKVKVYLYDDLKTMLKWHEQYAPMPYTNVKRFLGSFCDDAIACYIVLERNSAIETVQWITHELVHLIYRDEVQCSSKEEDRIIWFDEGLAQFLSGEYDNLKDDNNFKNWITKNIVGPNKEIPDISFLTEHGTSYGQMKDNETYKYDGYQIAYIMIRYLNENLSSNDFQILMRSKQAIEKIGIDLPFKACSYYCSKFDISLENCVKTKTI